MPVRNRKTGGFRVLRTISLALGLVLLCSTSVHAQPYINIRGIVNAASFAPPDSPAGDIARGSIFSIFGTGLGPQTWAQVSQFPLQSEFQGVSIRVTQGAVTANAIPLFVSATQINAIMPSTAPLGKVLVRVVFSGVSSNPAPLTVVEHAVGVFAATGAGTGPGAIQNFITGTNQPLNSILESATRNQYATLWATGLGPISAPDNLAPPVGNLPFPVEILVGNEPATNVAYAGRAPCCAGVDQIVFQIPAAAPYGCYVPVWVRVANRFVGNMTTIAITAQGGRCTDAQNPAAAVLTEGGLLGNVNVSRTILKSNLTGPASTVDLEIGASRFADYTANLYAFDPSYLLPPVGTCAAYTARGDPDTGVAIPGGQSVLASPGEVQVKAGAGSKKLNAMDQFTPFGFGILGQTDSLLLLQNVPILVNPGNFTVSVAGSGEIGAFEAGGVMPQATQWTNEQAITTVVRREGVTLNFSSPADAQALIVGGNVNLPINTTGFFVCLPPAGATSFTVPPLVLANVPVSTNVIVESIGFLYVGARTVATPASFQAAKVKQGIIQGMNGAAKTITYQ